ncbi:MAG TPA: hypothetical protein VJ733_04350, partial [Candidatus Binatia bacterium]|nr:hypothetical protein [Candidatus Binatia bacterium]
MKKIKCLIVAWSVMMFMGGIIARAEADETVSVGATADFYSKYLWRGQVLSDKRVLQPSISAGAYGFTGSLWANMNLSDSD